MDDETALIMLEEMLQQQVEWCVPQGSASPDATYPQCRADS